MSIRKELCGDRRMPKGALMSGFEKPPSFAPNSGKGAGRAF